MLAPYFEKNLLSLSQVVAEYNESSILQYLKTIRVGIAVDSSCLHSKPGKLIADMLVRTMSRLYPKLAIIPLDDEAVDFCLELKDLAKAINPRIAISSKRKGCDALAIIGGTADSSAGPNTYYVGAKSDRVIITENGPIRCAGTNPFSAGAAACYAAAVIFNQLFSEYLDPCPSSDLPMDFSFSERFLPWTTGNQLQQSKDIGDAALVGLGAIGNGALWLLKNFPVKGRLDLVDHEEVDSTNIQRYVCAVYSDRGKPKTELGNEIIASRRSLIVTPRKMRWQEYVRTIEFKSGLIGVALDSKGDRIDVQSSLPRVIVNSWTQNGQVGISRHGFSNGKACLACLYIPEGDAPNEDELVALAIGIDPKIKSELLEVRRRLQLNVPCEEEYLNQIALRLNIDPASLNRFAGRPLHELYQKGICATATLVGKGDSPEQFETPMPHQSALAGIILAANLLAAASPEETEGHKVTTRADLLHHLGTTWHYDEAPRAKCICQDKDYREVYREKYEDI